MLNKYLLFIIFLLPGSFVYAQNGNRVTKSNEIPDCESFAYNSSNMFMYYFSIAEYDSAEIVLSEWDSVCGKSEPIVRLQILIAIYRGNFSEALYDSTIVDYVLNYLNRMEVSSAGNTYENYPDYFGYIPIRGDFDFFTQSLADSLLAKNIFYDPAEVFFSELYANISPKPLEIIIKDSIFAGSDFKHYYFKRVDKYRHKPDYHYSISSGIWIPFDYASLLGIHPLIGFQVGIRFKKMTYNLALSFKFGKSKNEYEILVDGNLRTTDEFFGGYIAADIEREILKFRKHEFDLLGGVGYDSFDAIHVNTEDDNPENDVSHLIGSANINFGLGYRYYMKYKRYIGIQGKYNFVNYNNPGGTPLSGNTVTVSLIFGRFSNLRKDYYLNELRFDE